MHYDYYGVFKSPLADFLAAVERDPPPVHVVPVQRGDEVPLPVPAATVRPRRGLTGSGWAAGYAPAMDTLQALAAARETGRQAVLVTVVAVEGEPPSYAGAKLAVADGQVLAGTLGCSEFDTAGIALAGELADSGGSATLRRRLVFGHGEEQALDLFAELHEPQPAVVVFGDNPIGRGVAELAGFLGRRVVLLYEGAQAAFEDSPAGPADAVLLSDHDAPYVDDVLKQALAGPAFFVGMLGSRRHAPMVMQRLRDDGVPPDQVERLHSPCGLDIGSRGPAKIALSVVAEIVALELERGRSGGPMQMHLP